MRRLRSLVFDDLESVLGRSWFKSGHKRDLANDFILILRVFSVNELRDQHISRPIVQVNDPTCLLALHGHAGIHLVLFYNFRVLRDADIADSTICNNFHFIAEKVDEVVRVASHSMPPIIRVESHWQAENVMASDNLEKMSDLDLESCRLLGKQIAQSNNH